MNVTAKVRGSRQTSAALRELSRYVTVPVNAASLFALKPTLKAAKFNAHALPFKESTGALADSLVIKRSGRRGAFYRVGPSTLYEEHSSIYGVRKPVRYAHLVEFGTAPHSTGGSVRHPGSAPMPFMLPAYYETHMQVVKLFGERLGPEMEKRAAKLNAKAQR